MEENIFDLVSESGNIELPKDKSYLNDVKEYGKSILKGTAEGLQRLGSIMGPTSDIYGTPSSVKQQEFTQQLENILPSNEPESYGQRAIRKGLGQAPSALAFPGIGIEQLPRSIAAGFLGEGAKDLGAPEWAQTASELTAYIGPDITKKLLSSGNNKQIIDNARKLGFTDEQITPLIQSNFKQKWLSKLSEKRGATEEALKGTHGALSESWGTLAKSPKAAQEISERSNAKLINTIYNQLSEMPREVQNKILPDLNDLINNNITGRSLINFYKDINFKSGGSAKELAHIKGAVKNALASISPEIANDFGIVNDLYSRYYKISEKLKPSMASDIVRAAETIGVMSSIAGLFFGHFEPLLAIAGEKGARKIAQQTLINPRFQQLGTKMANALNESKFTVAKNLSKEMANLIKKDSPKIAEDLEKLSEEDFEKFFNQKQMQK